MSNNCLSKVGAALTLACGLFFQANAQTYNIPANASEVGTSSFIGTNASTTSSNTLRIGTNGIARMTINHAGNIGIGVDPGISSRLSVTGNTTINGNSFLNGQVRIGRTSGGNGNLSVFGASDTNPLIELSTPNGSGSEHRLHIGIASANGAYSPFATTGDKVIRTTGGDNGSNDLILSAENAGSSLRFGTNYAERMTINSTGKVGIGTNDPHDLLTLKGGDIRVIETDDYSNMPDGNGADISLIDKKGGYVNLYSDNQVGYLTVGGGSQELWLNQWGGIVRIGRPETPNRYSSTNTAGYNLYVQGGILAEKLKVAVNGTADWSDFVFDKNYKLKPLSEVEAFINKNKHLPEVPSAEEVVNSGIDVAKMDAKLLQKIEELTLYMIELQKQNQKLAKDVEELKKK